jgi:hypothetical protein
MLQRERVKDDRARGVWDRLVSALGKAAMVLALALPPFMVPRAEARVDHNLFVSAFARQVFALNTHCLAWLRRLLRFLTTRWTTGQTA